MDRRSFLKLVAVTTAAAAAPALPIAVPLTKADEGGTFLGLIRETYRYDAEMGAWDVSHDLFDGKTQISVQHFIPPSDFDNKEKMKEARAKAISWLAEDMKKEGMSFENLLPLPYPRGYEPVSLG